MHSNKTYYSKCPTCGKEKHQEMFDTHHIIPRSEGGNGQKENLITICKDCHYKIHHPNWTDGDIKQFEKEYKESIQNNLFSDGYGLLPRKVMRDTTISSTSKLLYVELSSLCAAKGYCWANNKYLADILHVSLATISASITQLEKYIVIEDRTSFKRKIWVHMIQSQPSRKLEGYHQENSKVNHQENSIHNSINNNNKINKISFDTFWNLYDKKIGRPKSESKWNKLTLKEQEAIVEYIPKYKIAQPNKTYRKNPETFFNNRSWEDELIADDKGANKGSWKCEYGHLHKRGEECGHGLERRYQTSQFAGQLSDKMKIKK